MSQKCTGTTKAGNPCQAWAVVDTDPPCCIAHGEDSGKVGAPIGNKNAETHGAYSNADQQPTDLSGIITDLQRRYDQLSTYIDDHLAKLEPSLYCALVALQGQIASRIGRLKRDQQQVAPDKADERQADLAEALKLVSQVLGIKLTN